MPAVTVDNILTLPSTATPEADTHRPRPVVSVTRAPSGFEGEGFPVRRAFAGVDMSLLDPFIHLDQMGEVNYGPGEPKGTPWHPHRGFETVTYIIDGAFQHRDSQGGGGLITNGDTQWMTAGGGILHIETPPEKLVASGGLFHGLQLWVNLPRSDKWADPRYQDLRADETVLVRSPDGGVLLRLIAGDLQGPEGTVHQGPGRTHTPITMVHATLAPGARLELPWRPDFNALAYVLSGHGSVGEDNQPIFEGQLAVHGAGDTVILQAAEKGDSRAPEMDVVLLGGQPINEPMAWAGPFVMNTRAEVIQAFEDFEKGELGQIPD